MKKLDYLKQQGFDEQEAERIASVITKFSASPAGVMPHEKTWDEIRMEIRRHNRMVFLKSGLNFNYLFVSIHSVNKIG